MNIRVINVLTVENNEFRVGEIVKVGIGTFQCPHDFEGKISAIGNSFLMIDSSEKYEENVRQIQYEKIRYIEKVDETI
jgi:hypothetical protein